MQVQVKTPAGEEKLFSKHGIPRKVSCQTISSVYYVFYILVAHHLPWPLTEPHNLKTIPFCFCVFSVPEADPSGESVVLGYYDFLQLKDRSRVLTAAEKAAMEESMRRDKEEKMVRHVHVAYRQDIRLTHYNNIHAALNGQPNFTKSVLCCNKYIQYLNTRSYE